MLKTSIFNSFLILIFVISSFSLIANEDVSIERPKQIISNFQNGNVDEIYNQFDSIMSQKLNPTRLAPIWKQLTANYGAFNGFGLQDTNTIGDNLVINTDLNFEKAVMNFMISVNSKSNKISGMYISEQEKKEEAPIIEHKLPNYIDTTKFKEIDVVVKDVFDLKGKMSMPNNFEKNIVFILVHGSGPNDMDETIGENKFFQNLAWGLASDGYGVLRYNKLTFEHGIDLVKINPKLTQKDEYNNSIKGAIKLIKENPLTNKSKIILIGHSQGASVITDFANDNSVDGLVLLSGSPRKLYDLYTEQLEYLFSIDGVETQAEKSMLQEHKDRINYFKSHNKNKIQTDSLPLGLNYEYWMYLEKYNPIENLKKSKKPTLIINGGHDYQVTKADFKLWESNLKDKSNIKFDYIDNVNHIYSETPKMSVPGDFQKYLPIVPILFKDIEKWVENL